MCDCLLVVTRTNFIARCVNMQAVCLQETHCSSKCIYSSSQIATKDKAITQLPGGTFSIRLWTIKRVVNEIIAKLNSNTAIKSI